MSGVHGEREVPVAEVGVSDERGPGQHPVGQIDVQRAELEGVAGAEKVQLASMLEHLEAHAQSRAERFDQSAVGLNEPDGVGRGFRIPGKWPPRVRIHAEPCAELEVSSGPQLGVALLRRGRRSRIGTNHPGKRPAAEEPRP